MEKVNWQEVQTVIEEVLDLPEEKRMNFVEKRCENSNELKFEVTQLLQSIMDSKDWLDDPEAYKTDLFLPARPDTREDTAMVGKKIGSYKIKEVIAHGGMGSVFRAEREGTTFNQTVALKLIRREMATPSNKARFKREQQILAGLSHPNIAQLFDGGVTADGLPYLVMECVDGQSILEYCDENKLNFEERIDLFKQVCRAVQYAHNNLVIHRDLKPDNILVTKDRQVKVLDFGIAKLLEPASDPGLIQTREGNRILTLNFAAPEQICNGPLTTSVDSYGLGTLLYQLLTGVHPFDLNAKKSSEIEALIKDTAPLHPAKRFAGLPENLQAELAEKRSVGPAQLAGKLKSDVAAIIQKNLRKEPGARYETVEKFLEDLNRYGQNLPVAAREGTLRYYSGKFLKRHKIALSVAGFFILLITAFGFFYTWQITGERNIAQFEAEKAREVSSFLIEMFEASDPLEQNNENITARDLLERGSERILELNNEEIRADLLLTIGKAYNQLGSRDKSLALIDRSINIHETSSSRNQLAEAYFEKGIVQFSHNYLDLALPNFKKAIDIWEQEPVENTANLGVAYQNLGMSLLQLGEADSAEIFIDKSLTIFDNDQKKEELAESKFLRADILRDQGNYDEAEQLYKEVISMMGMAQSSEEKMKLSDVYNRLSFLYIRQNQHNKAVPYLETCLAIDEEILGKGHSSTLRSRNNLAGTLGVLGDDQREEELYYENIMHVEVEYGRFHRQTVQSYMAYSHVLVDHKKYPKAEAPLKMAIELSEKTFGEDHIWTLYAYNVLAANLFFQRKSEANGLYNTYYGKLKENTPNFNRINQRQISLLIDMYKKAEGEYEDQIAAYQKLINQP